MNFAKYTGILADDMGLGKVNVEIRFQIREWAWFI